MPNASVAMLSNKLTQCRGPTKHRFAISGVKFLDNQHWNNTMLL